MIVFWNVVRRLGQTLLNNYKELRRKYRTCHTWHGRTGAYSLCDAHESYGV